MLLGYARVSTMDQNLDLQQDALQAAGCTRIFKDTARCISCRSPAGLNH
jgi:DNA invertase Pin-like site-specific DNA recombinase